MLEYLRFGMIEILRASNAQEYESKENRQIFEADNAWIFAIWND